MGVLMTAAGLNALPLGWLGYDTAQSPAVFLASQALGAVAGGTHPDLPQAMAAMSAAERTFEPSAETAGLHAARFQAFRRLQDVAREIARAG